MSGNAYIGNELEVFAHAVHWKRYYGSKIAPLLGRSVLEVGAGLGETTRHLYADSIDSWLCLEPDPEFCRIIEDKIAAKDLPDGCSVLNGTTESLKGREGAFDTILYIDVLEHIEDDRGELLRAAPLLKPDGRVVVLAPAHNFLFSPFDRQIGHFRRYDRAMLRDACPRELTIHRMEYLDSVGMLASLANRWFIKDSTPNIKQIALWDRAMVPVSRWIDPLLLHRLGKSLFAVMGKQSPAAR